MSKKGLLRGSKFSGRHQTFIDAAAPIIGAIKEFPEVSKIVLGEITPIGPGAMRLKFQPVKAGFKMTVRGGNSMQTLFVYTSNPALTEANATQHWNNLRS